MSEQRLEQATKRVGEQRIYSSSSFVAGLSAGGRVYGAITRANRLGFQSCTNRQASNTERELFLQLLSLNDKLMDRVLY